MPKSIHLSRRERQIMDIVYELNEASAKEILAKLPDPPSYSAVRAMLSKLETKGHLKHRESELKYVYSPTVDQSAARDSALSRLLKTFFDGSASQAVNALIDLSSDEISEQELSELEAVIEQARKAKEKKAKKNNG
jgi:predicted transcriptional regulator